MELAALEQQRRLPKVEALSLRPLLEELVASAEARAVRRAGCAGAGGRRDGPVEGEGVLLRRAVGNLLANTLEFSPEGGTVHVALRCAQRRRHRARPGPRFRSTPTSVCSRSSIRSRDRPPAKEEHRPRPGVREGDRRASPRPRHCATPTAAGAHHALAAAHRAARVDARCGYARPLRPGGLLAWNRRPSPAVLPYEGYDDERGAIAPLRAMGLRVLACAAGAGAWPTPACACCAPSCSAMRAGCGASNICSMRDRR